MKLWNLKRGQRFRVHGMFSVYRFDHMDGMYAHVYDDAGELHVFATGDDVEVVE